MSHHSSLYGSFLSAVNYIKSQLPASKPVMVRRVRMNEAGWSYYSDKIKKYVIKVHRDLCEDAAVLTFLHEYAHVLSWDVYDHPEIYEHGALFGHFWCLVWRTFAEEIKRDGPLLVSTNEEDILIQAIENIKDKDVISSLSQYINDRLNESC